MQLVDCFYEVQHWNAYHLQNDPPKLKQLYLEQAAFIGGFNLQGKMIGILVVSNQFIHDDPDARLLHYFYIDADQQGQGIGAQLMQATSAIQPDANDLYISAAPNKRTVDFYMKHGAEVLQKTDQPLWQLEPEDIHLLCKI